MLTLYVSHIRPIIDYGSSVWNVGYIGDMRRLESIQRRWTREIVDVRGMDYGSRLKTLGLHSVFGRLLRADLIKVWKSFHCLVGVGLSNLFERARDSRTRGHSFKLSVPRLHTDGFRRSFGVRCVAEWNSLPGDVVELDSLQTFKSSLAFCLGDRLYEFR